MTDEQFERWWRDTEEAGGKRAMMDIDVAKDACWQAWLEARNEALEEAAQAFEAAYSDHEEPLIGVMYGLKAIRSLAERERT